MTVDFTRGFSTFVDGSNHQGLSASAVTGDKNVLDIGFVAAVFGFVVRPLVVVDAQRVGGVMLWTQETHGEKDEVCGSVFFRPRHVLKLAVLHCYFHGANASQLTLFVTKKAQR